MNKKNPAVTATAKRSRRVLDDAFKTKVVLEALKEAIPLNELPGPPESDQSVEGPVPEEREHRLQWS